MAYRIVGDILQRLRTRISKLTMNSQSCAQGLDPSAGPSNSPPNGMQIPVGAETAEEFSTRVSSLMSKPSTHVYIDTSFLMWLTKIGRTSRRELVEWLDVDCRQRTHVPVWSAHEYLRHHVARTIVGDLDAKVRALSTLASGSYAYLRPFLDDPISPTASTAEPQRLAVRDALTEIANVAETAGNWKAAYEQHASEVTAFINSHSPNTTNVFAYMAEIEALGAGRFAGRLPPGFQDRRKKETVETNAEDEEMEVKVGSNRWGDLILWKEILDHARDAEAKTIVILSNDRKNDWHLGGGGKAPLSRVCYR